MTVTRDELRRELFMGFGEERFPDPIPINLKILSKRSFLEYEEWKIEYDVETVDTMPTEAGWRVPAYLLVPRVREKPLPAMLCLHQCAEDCVVAKEAVVGKVPWAPANNTTFFETDGRVSLDRTDQAYGYELVHEGFVVLAPDSINCGERNIDAIRRPGQVKICHQIIDPHLGKEAEFKRTIDGMRAIDVLESLDFVDSERIGAVGHSMGAAGVYWLMAFDERVKAGIMGSRHMGGTEGRFYPLIAPRLFMALWGAFDCGDQKELQDAYDYAHDCYSKVGAPDNVLIRKLDVGHRFADEFKWEAYKKLKEYFGILPERNSVSLVSMAEDARRVTSDSWHDQNVSFPVVTGRDCRVFVNRVQMVSAIAGLYLYLSDRSSDISLTVSVDGTTGRPCLHCVCTSDQAIPKDPPPAGCESLRGVRQILAEHDAELGWEHSGKDATYRIVFAMNDRNEEGITSNGADKQ